MKKASYRGIPCRYNSVTDELVGSNWFLDTIISIIIFFDAYILKVDGFPVWVEVDDLENN